jgi:hypothetical protein
MPRKALSVTLDAANVTWLKGRAGAMRESLSEVLDQIVTLARHSGPAIATRSVVGTIDLDASDPLLERADATVRTIFDRSLGRPLAAKEGQGSSGGGKGKRPARRG